MDTTNEAFKAGKKFHTDEVDIIFLYVTIDKGTGENQAMQMQLNNNVIELKPFTVTVLQLK